MNGNCPCKSDQLQDLTSYPIEAILMSSAEQIGKTTPHTLHQDGANMMNEQITRIETCSSEDGDSIVARHDNRCCFVPVK